MTESAPGATLTRLPAWQALQAHHATVKDVHLRQLFADDPVRGERLALEGVGLYLDFSKHRITGETLRLLVRLADESGLRSRIDAMFAGERINVTENRAVLHMALRAPRDATVLVDGENVVPHVHEVLDRMAAFRRPGSGRRLDRPYRPTRSETSSTSASAVPTWARSWPTRRYATTAERDMTFRFVSNVDGTDFAEATRDLDPAETLFIVSSKTFTTLETMTNARTARAWLLQRVGRRGAPWPGTSWRSPPTPTEVTAFGIDTGQHVRLLGLGGRPLLHGLRHRPLHHDRRGPGQLPGACWTGSTPWTNTSAPPPSSATCRCSWGF